MKRIAAVVGSIAAVIALSACDVETEIKSTPPTPAVDAPKSNDKGKSDTEKLTPESLAKCLNSDLVTEVFISSGWSVSIEVITSLVEHDFNEFDQWEADQKKGELLTRQAKRCISADGPVYIEFQYADGGILDNELL